MALVPGTRLGPYEVVGPLGAGGMGEVYRAKDTKLGREVALKLLPEHLAQDPERLARFEREARTLAALNHPHIAQVYGLEDAPSPTGSGAGLRALVMELVEGPTLAERIASLGAAGASTRQTGLPLDEALPIAQQIAEALEAAHDQGIVHRDLKPANIKVRPDGSVKVLDFGLAKAVAAESGVLASETLAVSPTITSPAMTMRGVILGTAAYMSPEQAKGKPVDRRADIWAFGCVLFEMLTGRRAFEGEDVSDTLAAVLRGEPAWDALPAATPAHVRTLLARCIERDVKKRLPHIGVARLELVDSAFHASALAAPTPVVSRSSWRVHATWAAMAIAGVAGAIYLSRPSVATAPSVVRFAIRPADGEVFPGANGVPRFAVSPDGTKVVFAASAPGKYDRLYVRDLSSTRAVPIAGVEVPANGGDGLQQPFFSPDGSYLAFFSGLEGALKRVPIGGGTVERLATLPAANPGGTWHGDVILVASGGTRGVQRMPAGGGALTPVTTLDEGRGETAHLWPHFLPDGRRFLYLAAGKTSAIFVGTLDGGPPVHLVDASSPAWFAPSGSLLYVRDSVLVAQAFDPDRLALTGTPVPVSASVLVANNTRAGVAVSRSGTLVVAEGEGAGGGAYEVRRLDRRGRPVGEGALEPSVFYFWVRLAPGGDAIAYSRVMTPGSPDVWAMDLRRGVRTRVTTAAGTDQAPVWSPDGRRLVYQSNRETRESDGRHGLYERDAGAIGPERRLVAAQPGHPLFAESWSPAGTTRLVRDGRDVGGMFGLREGVLAWGCVEHEQHVVRGAGYFFLDGTVDFSQFLHEVYFVVQAACRINYGDIAAVFEGVVCRFVGYGAGVGVHALGEKVTADTLRPDFQLIHGCGAEGIGGAEHDFVAALFELGCQLADSGCFAHTVHADHEQDVRFFPRWNVEVLRIGGVVFAQQLHNLVAQQVVEFVGIHILVAGYTGLNAFDDLDGGV